ncbi:hypothetical protein KBZ10_18005 [Streptomyces sp. F63]|uniref:hypothetical protein n=1 Tax=Streptomyces sp. F63 TaxID=2824887 RepID=UPI001B35A6FA|nr:hypothetical protein [Streptomyces sp. F63]MBQ0986370.1 hypothetical protein [Streptomyces sp. F63]
MNAPAAAHEVFASLLDWYGPTPDLADPAVTAAVVSDAELEAEALADDPDDVARIASAATAAYAAFRAAEPDPNPFRRYFREVFA